MDYICAALTCAALTRIESRQSLTDYRTIHTTTPGRHRLPTHPLHWEGKHIARKYIFSCFARLHMICLCTITRIMSLFNTLPQTKQSTNQALSHNLKVSTLYRSLSRLNRTCNAIPHISNIILPVSCKLIKIMQLNENHKRYLDQNSLQIIYSENIRWIKYIQFKKQTKKNRSLLFDTVGQRNFNASCLIKPNRQHFVYKQFKKRTNRIIWGKPHHSQCLKYDNSYSRIIIFSCNAIVYFGK